MAIDNFDKKLELLSFLVFLYGKLIKLAVIMERLGLDSAPVRKKESEASKIIDQLRSDMYRSWNGQATELMKNLRGINNSAQRKVRELEGAVDRVKKVSGVLNEIDRALALVGRL